MLVEVECVALVSWSEAIMLIRGSDPAWNAPPAILLSRTGRWELAPDRRDLSGQEYRITVGGADPALARSGRWNLALRPAAI